MKHRVTTRQPGDGPESVPEPIDVQAEGVSVRLRPLAAETGVPRSDLDTAIGDALADYRDADVRAFVGILVERQVRDWLCGARASPHRRDPDAPRPRHHGPVAARRPVDHSPDEPEPVDGRFAGTRAAPAVRMSGVDLFYGGFRAVADLDLAVPPNAVTALIGPSGCGKSTVLRSLNRLHELVPGARVSGSVLLGEEDIYGRGVDPEAVRRRVGMVFQTPNPFPTLSVRDNVVASQILRDGRRAGDDGLAEQALRATHLWDEVRDRLGQPGRALSGGQQQRLCIARAIAVDPEVLLLDEPCSSLDPLSTTAIEHLVTQLKRRYTIVIVTHNMQQAARISDHAAFFSLERQGDPGRLVEAGPSARIFGHPERTETLDFVAGRFG